MEDSNKDNTVSEKNDDSQLRDQNQLPTGEDSKKDVKEGEPIDESRESTEVENCGNYNLQEDENVPPDSKRPELKKKTIALDIDDTLIYKVPEEITGKTHTMKYKFEDETKKVYFKERPGIRKFLRRMQKHYNIVAYSNGTHEYVEGVLNTMGIREFFTHIYHREHCEEIENDIKHLKHVEVIKGDPKDIIFVDNAPVHIEENIENGLRIEPFTGDDNDNEFERLAPFLVQEVKKEDVRPVFVDYTNYLQTLTPKMQAEKRKPMTRSQKRLEKAQKEYKEEVLGE